MIVWNNYAAPSDFLYIRYLPYSIYLLPIFRLASVA